MIKQSGLVILLGVALASVGQAATTKKPAAAPAKTVKAEKPAKAEKTTTEPADAVAPSAASSATQTDVIGSKESPSVFNVVPWKDKAADIPKREVSTSILRSTLQPLDRDVLKREVLLQEALNRD